MTTSADTTPDATVRSRGGSDAVRLSILLVNYNGMRYLEPCLESIRCYAPVGSEVILEDNASTDGSPEVAQERFPHIQVIRSDRNLGFSAGNNLAGKSARGRFLLLLNTDTLLLEPLAPVIDWLESHVDYGALTISMLDGQRVLRACTGRFPTVPRLALLRSMLVAPETYGAEQAYDVDWMQGSFLLIRSDLWRALDGLDERYFMYAEDLDLSKRVHDAGFRCAYLPQWKYLHWGGFSTSRFPNLLCSFSIYVDKHMLGFERYLAQFVLLAGCLLRAAAYRCKAVLSGNAGDRSNATAFWQAWKALLRRKHRGNSD
jgi:hypothetical protein